MMKNSILALLGALVLASGMVAQQGPEAALVCWPQAQRGKQLAYEARLKRIPDPERLRHYHEQFSDIPHSAGSAGDLKMVGRLQKAFREAGLEVTTQPIWVYLSRFVSGRLEIVTPEKERLPIREDILATDPYSGHKDLNPGWNAYAASGDVTAEVVYANYGTKADFEHLARLGVSVQGKIVIARYGRNYRGFKVKFAEAAGAIGLIIYTDPADSGYQRGIMYPEGGYANPSSIQRGSIKTIPYPGDPLTPFVPATQNAKRLDPKTLALPKIPVQPVGWRAAERIMTQMRGKAVPRKWQGGLPLTYRLTGGNHLKVRIAIEQERRVVKTMNVTGTVKGAVHPEQKIVLGCHHDAWGFGAGDPMAGMMVLMEAARSFAAAAKAGHPPARSLVFAAWAAEEHGIIGSVEWVEANRDDLARNCVAYINLDMAAMGTRFRAGAAPALRRVIAAATRTVQQLGSDQTVFTDWHGRGQDPAWPDEPRFSDLGGGSDHVGFYCHLGIPSAGLGVGGSRGVSYHSIYDNLAWYRKVVGDDYQPAAMLTRIVNVLSARLACAPLLPLDPVRIASHLQQHLTRLSHQGEAVGITTAMNSFDTNTAGTAAESPRPRIPAGISTELATVASMTMAYEKRVRIVYDRVLAAVADDKVPATNLAEINQLLMALDRAWLHPPGLPGRPWYRNLYAATDEDSGYAAWVLPAICHAINHRDADRMTDATRLYTGVLARLQGIIADLEKQLD